MFFEIAYFYIFNLPLFIFMGILALISLILTALVPVLNSKGIRVIPLKYHPLIAKITFILALLHGFLAALVIFNF